MRNLYLMLAWLCAAFPAQAADEQRIIKLEQDMRNLERRVQDQAREIEQLRRELGRPTAPTATPAAPEPPDPSDAWLKAANWDRVRPGMSELEVIDLLGPPTAVRGGEGTDVTTLLYAMEIGTAAFLSGSVALADGRVISVERPTLK